MSKTLEVISPFFMLETGDTFELSEDGKRYVAEYNDEFTKNDDSDSFIQSTYSSKFTISPDYAKELIEDGYLEEVKQTKTDFVNIFSEIDSLIERYTNELNSINKDYANMPECLKVEKKTVLENINKVLNHLKSLKK